MYKIIAIAIFTLALASVTVVPEKIAHKTQNQRYMTSTVDKGEVPYWMPSRVSLRAFAITGACVLLLHVFALDQAKRINYLIKCVIYAMLCIACFAGVILCFSVHNRLWGEKPYSNYSLGWLITVSCLLLFHSLRENSIYVIIWCIIYTVVFSVFFVFFAYFLRHTNVVLNKNLMLGLVIIPFILSLFIILTGVAGVCESVVIFLYGVPSYVCIVYLWFSDTFNLVDKKGNRMTLKETRLVPFDQNITLDLVLMAICILFLQNFPEYLMSFSSCLTFLALVASCMLAIVRNVADNPGNRLRLKRSILVPSIVAMITLFIWQLFFEEQHTKLLESLVAEQLIFYFLGYAIIFLSGRLMPGSPKWGLEALMDDHNLQFLLWVLCTLEGLYIMMQYGGLTFSGRLYHDIQPLKSWQGQDFSYISKLENYGLAKAAIEKIRKEASKEERTLLKHIIHKIARDALTHHKKALMMAEKAFYSNDSVWTTIVIGGLCRKFHVHEGVVGMIFNYSGISRPVELMSFNGRRR